MPIKYVGRTTDQCGKTLWEILGNLENFGVGRLVKRNMFERYPEPSFFKILKVDTVMNEPDRDRRVRAYVEKVFRGRRYPKVIEVFKVSYKPDYRLVPKSEEKELWDRVAATERVQKDIPSSAPFPALLRHMILEDMKNQGLKITEEPLLKLKINKGRESFYRLVDQVPKGNASIESSGA